MSTHGNSFQFKIITPDKVIFDDVVSHITIPGADGPLGIFPNHAPLITATKNGRVETTKIDDEFNTYDINGGFFTFENNKSVLFLNKY